MQKFWLFPALAALSLTTAPVARSQTAFTDVSNAAGVAYTGESYGASFGDLNGDGYLDIYASNHRNKDSLFLNRGNGTFLDVATPRSGSTTWLRTPMARAGPISTMTATRT